MVGSFSHAETNTNTNTSMLKIALSWKQALGVEWASNFTAVSPL